MDKKNRNMDVNYDVVFNNNLGVEIFDDNIIKIISDKFINVINILESSVINEV